MLAALGRIARVTALVAWMFGGMFSSTSIARAYSPIPAYPGPGGVATSVDVAITPAPIAELLRAHQSPVGALYSVLYVEYSDRENRPGPDYGDEDQAFINSVVEAWGSHADMQSSIFIVVSMSNRDVIVHPFSRFASLGWEREAVQQTIEESPFALYARSGDQAQAILALVNAIDAELGTRIERAEADARFITNAARNARASVARFEQTAIGSRYSLDAARVHATRLLERTRRLEQATARAEWSNARQLASQVVSDSVRLDHWIEELDWEDAGARTRLRALETARADLARHPRLHDSDVATNTLRSLDAALVEARQRLGAGDPRAAARSLDEAETAREACGEALVAAEFSARLWFRIVPLFAGIFALAWLFYSLIDRRLRADSKRAEAASLLDALETALGHASAKLVEIENEHAAFLAGGRSPSEFVGESREPIRACASLMDDLFIEFEAATRVAREAKRRLNDAGAFDPKGVDRAIAALTTEPVVVRTEQVLERKLLLPDQREVRRLPSDLLREVERSYARALEALDTLGSRIGAAHERIAGLGRRLGKAQQDADDVRRRLPTPALATKMAPLEARRAAIADASQLDPIGSEAAISAFENELDDLEALVRKADETEARIADTIPAAVGAQTARVSDLRAQGFRLAEPWLRPEETLGEVETLRHEAKGAFTLGELERAATLARRSDETLAELVRKLDDCEAVRATHAEAVPRERNRRATLEQGLEGRRAQLEALRAKYTDASLMPALDNVVEAEATLTRVATTLDAVETELAPPREHWLAAKRQLDRASRALGQVEALYAEIDGKAEELASIVDEVDADLGVVGGLEREFALLRERAEPLGRTELADETRAIGASLATLVASRAAAPIAVHELCSQADALVARAEAARSLLVRAVTELEELEHLRGALDDTTTALGASLASATEDGAEANTLFARAAAEVAAIKAEWPALVRDPGALRARMDQALDLVTRARTRAASDYEQASLARAQAAAAHNELLGAEASLSSRAYRDLDIARTKLRDAQDALRDQRYVEAESLAQGARKLVRARVDEENRAAEVERERVRRATELAAQRTASSSRSSSSSWSSSSSSDSSGFSWGSSSSSGRSSRRSSSGSSSFGSSSGRSSFGSSSGRSKW